MASDTTVRVNSTGVGFLGLLTLLFAAGKIFGYLDWSWWFVFLPIWGPFVLSLALLLIFGVIVLVAGLIDNRQGKKRRKTRQASRALNSYSRSITPRR